MAELLWPHDHAEIAWNHFLAQHVGKERTEQFVRSFYQPLLLLDQAQQELYTDRWLDTAVGAQLDGIGSIVGQSRRIDRMLYLAFFGFRTQIAGRAFSMGRLRRKNEPWVTSQELGDTDYRTLIRLKIMLNNSRGTAEEVVQAIETVLRVERTWVMDAGNANGKIFINDWIMSWDPRSEMIQWMMPRAAGVKFWFYLWDMHNTFGFSNQNMGYKGFYQGIFARQMASNIPPLKVAFSGWDNHRSLWDQSLGGSVWDQQ